MASRFFVPSTSASGVEINSTNFWSATRGGAAGASVPGTSDTAYIESGSNVITSTSTSTVNTLIVGPGSNNVFGSSGSSLGINGTTLNYAGQGAYAYISGNWTTINVDDTGTGTFFHTGGTGTTINCGPSGTVYVQSAAGSPTTLRSSGARVVVGQSTSPITTAVFAGVSELGRPGATIEVEGNGRLTMVGTATGTVATTLIVHSGGRCDDRSVGDKSVVETRPGGAYDASNAKSGFTIDTNRPWVGSSVNTNGKGVSITINSTDRIGAR